MKKYSWLFILLGCLYLNLVAIPSVYAQEITFNIPVLGEKFFQHDTSKVRLVWAEDKKTGSQVGYILKGDFFDSELQSASWDGAIVDGKAAGKGHLQIVLKRTIAAVVSKEVNSKAQIIEYFIQGDVEMEAGLLHGAANLERVAKNSTDVAKDNKGTVVSFTGTFIAGLEEGYGKMLWQDKVLFEGEWKAGWEDKGYLLKVGGPALRFTYEGEINQGKANGIGKVTIRNFGTYEGEFKDGKYHGEGIFRYQSFHKGGLNRDDEIAGGASFVGTFSNDQANGYGVFKDGHGQIIYAGQWQNGKAVNNN